MSQQPTHIPEVKTAQVSPKQTWHKPTLTFVPIQMTASGSGTTSDGNTSSTQS